jgi:hypothetical protein
MLERLELRSRARAAGIHTLISALIAALAAALVFGLWFPDDFRLLSGGRDLFLLVTSVDVVLGPLLTFTVFNLKKGWPHLRRDLAVIGVIQLIALGYGLHTVSGARPVAMVFEVDRFRVVTADSVYRPELPDAAPEYRSLPLTGPWLLAAMPPQAGDERNKALFMALEGVDVGQRPRFWRPYEENRSEAIARSRPFEMLVKKYPERAREFAAALSSVNQPTEEARFLPVMARGDWVVVLRKNGDIATFLQADGFF